jgi:hypothetical protein
MKQQLAVGVVRMRAASGVTAETSLANTHPALPEKRREP